MMHSFNTALAAKYGIVEAVLLEHLAFWIRKNKANNVNAYDGRYWTYNSLRAYEELFPYLTAKQIRRALQKLIQEGVVVDGNFNKSPYDRTKWYSFTDEGMSIIGEYFRTDANSQIEFFICPEEETDLPKRENVNDQEGKPIPDTIPVSYSDIETGVKQSLINARDTNRDKGYKTHKEYISSIPCIRDKNPCQIWDENFFPISSNIAQELESLVRKFGEGAVKYGLEVAVENNVKTIAYVTACARNYENGIDYKQTEAYAKKVPRKNDVVSGVESAMMFFETEEE